MKKILLFSTLIITLSFGYSAKGMVTYKKLCSSCHGPAFKGAAMLESQEWKEMFDKDASVLKDIHKNDKKALKTLKSRYFKRRKNALRDFMINNARDKGIVRSCDGLNCG